MIKNKHKVFSAVAGFLSLVFMWLVWFIAEKAVKNEYLVPGFSQTVNELISILCERFFWRALGKTLVRVLYAFLISFVLAGFCALLGRVFKIANEFFKPIIAVIRTLPTMAVLTVILIYSNRTVAPIIVAVMVMFPMIFAQFNVALSNINANVINTAKLFNIPTKTRIFKIYLPLASPVVLSHIGTNISFGIKLVISAEVMVSSFTSIGGMISYADPNVARVMALTLISVVLGLIIEALFRLIFKRCFKWANGGLNDD